MAEGVTVVSTKEYRLAGGLYRLVGDVQNNGDDYLTGLSVVVDFFDASGGLLATRETRVREAGVGANQRATFEVALEPSGSLDWGERVASHQVTVVGGERVATPPSLGGFRFEDLYLTRIEEQGGDGGLYEVGGRLVSSGQEELTDLRFVATAYDWQGTAFALEETAGLAMAEAGEVGAGLGMPFRMVFPAWTAGIGPRTFVVVAQRPGQVIARARGSGVSAPRLTIDPRAFSEVIPRSDGEAGSRFGEIVNEGTITARDIRVYGRFADREDEAEAVVSVPRLAPGERAAFEWRRTEGWEESFPSPTEVRWTANHTPEPSMGERELLTIRGISLSTRPQNGVPVTALYVVLVNSGACAYEPSAIVTLYHGMKVVWTAEAASPGVLAPGESRPLRLEAALPEAPDGYAVYPAATGLSCA